MKPARQIVRVLSVVFFFLVLNGFTVSSFPVEKGETAITWETLTDVSYNRKFNQKEEMYFMYPTFGGKVRQLEGKVVTIRGYMIPVDETGEFYVISEKPMAQCFFCGGSGPESLIELDFRKKGRRFKTDEIRTLRGVLKLNAEDVEHLNYILTAVEVVK
ncbi:hypothetical protein GCM10023091_02220 [Ravibacter arvi]|uniref:DUF3299 domain-containing protein n=1 Tax=Ravibacter arvi TaxID=2051041 RepID=A0ABP8LNH7_9BACT